MQFNCLQYIHASCATANTNVVYSGVWCILFLVVIDPQNLRIRTRKRSEQHEHEINSSEVSAVYTYCIIGNLSKLDERV